MKTTPPTFANLVASRRGWIDDFLRPWCLAARRSDLLLAEAEWADIAGRVDPKATLWTWAWSRFPALVYEGLSGINETVAVTVTLDDGSEFTGFPDNRQSEGGRLVLAARDERNRPVEHGPFSIDEIRDVRPAE